MRKKLLVVLLLVVMLVVQVVPAYAAELSIGEQIKALPGPAEGTNLAYKFDAHTDADGNFKFPELDDGSIEVTNLTGNDYKILTYVASTNTFWYGIREEVPLGEIVVEELNFYQATDFSDALSKAEVTVNRLSYKTLDLDDAYIVFFNSSASSLTDAEFACKVSDLLNFVYDPYAGLVEYDGHPLQNNVSVELVEKLEENGGVVGAKYRLNYDLEGYVRDGYIYPEYAERVHIKDSRAYVDCTPNSKGSIEFILAGAEFYNREYIVYLSTEAGNSYFTSLVIDFANTEGTVFTGSTENPIVTFDGLPDQNAKDVVGPILVTMHSDIPAKLTWNGQYLGDGFITSGDITISSNGTYYYTATTEAGMQTTGTITIDCLVHGTAPVENPNIEDMGNHLVQTGEERDSNTIFLVISIIVAVICVSAGILLIKKRGLKNVVSIIAIVVIALSLSTVAYASSLPWYGAANATRETGFRAHVNTSTVQREVTKGFYSVFRQGYVERPGYILRIKAIPFTSVDEDMGYFYVHGDTIDMKTDNQLVGMDVIDSRWGYNTTIGWLYLCDGGDCLDDRGNNLNPNANDYRANSKFNLVHTFGDGHYEIAEVSKPNAPMYKQFVEACGASWNHQDLLDFNTLTALIHGSDQLTLGQFLGLTPDECTNYYIVAEMTAVHRQYLSDTNGWAMGVEAFFADRHFSGHWSTSSDDYVRVDTSKPWNLAYSQRDHAALYEWLATETRATLSVYEDPLLGQVEWIFGTGGAISHNAFDFKNRVSASTDLFTKIRNVNLQQTEAPWGNFELGYAARGYALYGFGDLEASAMAGANIAVEYQGDVNTSYSDKFTVAGTLLTTNDDGNRCYYKFTTGTWVPASDSSELMQFGSQIIVDEYSVIKSEADPYRLYTDILVKPNIKDSFTTDIITGGFNLVWRPTTVSGSAVVVGNTYGIFTINGYTDLRAVRDRFETSLKTYPFVTTPMPPNGQPVVALGVNITSGAGGTTSSGAVPAAMILPTDNVVTACWNNTKKAYQYSSEDAVDVYSTGEFMLKKGTDYGVGFEFIIRGSRVESRKITFTINVNDDYSFNSMTTSQTWEDSYTTVSYARTTTSPNIVAYIISAGLDDALTGAIEDKLKEPFLATVGYGGSYVASAMSSVAGSACRVSGSGGGGTTITLGSEGSPPAGYTIYEVLITPPPGGGNPTYGVIELPEWMLNRYFDNIIRVSSSITSPSGVETEMTLVPEWTWKKWNISYHTPSDHGYYPYNSSYDQDWIIQYRDTSSSKEFQYDNAKKGYYYPRATGATWSQATRALLTRNWTTEENTESISPLTFDYGFNLIRYGANDNRVISGISYSNYGVVDSIDLLKLQSAYNSTNGIKPYATIASAENVRQYRSRVANTGVWTEQFNIESRYKWNPSAQSYTGSTSGYYVSAASRHASELYVSGSHIEHNHYEDGTRDCYEVDDWDWCGGCYYYTDGHKISHTALGFGWNGSPVNTIDYSFEVTVFKYQTSTLGNGWNDALASAGITASAGTTSNAAPVTSNAQSTQSYATTPLTSNNAYRFATVHYNGASLKYYPEHYMAYKIGNDDMSYNNGIGYKFAYVIGEVQRTADSSTLFFFKLNPVSSGSSVSNFAGTVYSDSMQGGTGGMGLGGTNLVSIPAGSDLTVAADPSTVQIDLYGYALDVVNKSTDDGHLGSSNRPFSSVVANGQNVYDVWGNNSSPIVNSDFEAWANSILDVKNFAADFKLEVAGTLKSENFSATVGRVDQSAATFKKDGVYQIVVEKGKLVDSGTTKGDYDALMRQIALDYFNDANKIAEARALFDASGIWQSIKNAMETGYNARNNSKGATVANQDRTNDLGVNGNWYDEVSRTFVIRRYTYVGSKLKDVVAEDKIDYSLAPTNTGAGENSGAGNSVKATWYLNIFFNPGNATDLNKLMFNYSGNGNYYNPSTPSTLSNALSSYTFLIQDMPISGADFYIPASSTSEFGH